MNMMKRNAQKLNELPLFINFGTPKIIFHFSLMENSIIFNLQSSRQEEVTGIIMEFPYFSINREYLLFFSVRSIFISKNECQTQYFQEWEAMSEHNSFAVHD